MEPGKSPVEGPEDLQEVVEVGFPCNHQDKVGGFVNGFASSLLLLCRVCEDTISVVACGLRQGHIIEHTASLVALEALLASATGRVGQNWAIACGLQQGHIIEQTASLVAFEALVEHSLLVESHGTS